MDDRTSPDFDTARRFEHELTDRQREVLGLIARGHTNAEIAEQLVLPLTAVKWHVSEVLAKLGFASREDAGEFWRWRNSAASQVRFRAASLLGFGLGIKKSVVIGTTALAGTGAMAAVAFALFATSTPEDPVLDEPGQPFYLEATHTSVEPGFDDPPDVVPFVPRTREEHIFHELSTIRGASITHVAVASKDAPPVSHETNMRWWFNTPAQWKWEQDTAGMRRIQAADGEFMLNYPLGADAFQKTPLDNYTTKIRDGFVPQMEMVGPSRARDIDELLAALRERPGQFADVVGHETVLGRDTTVIRYGPRGMDPGDTDATTTYRGQARIWLDEERMMIMRAESDLGNGYRYAVEVTRLDWGYTPTADQLAFNPPAGTSEAPRITLAAPPEGVVVEHYR